MLSTDVEGIKKKITGNADRLKGYKAIQVKSDVALMLVHMVRILPEGAWLNNLSVRYGADNKITKNISGYAYAEDFNKQLRSINALVTALRSSKELSNIVSGVQLTSMQREEIDNTAVTFFVINCS